MQAQAVREAELHDMSEAFAYTHDHEEHMEAAGYMHAQSHGQCMQLQTAHRPTGKQSSREGSAQESDDRMDTRSNDASTHSPDAEVRDDDASTCKHCILIRGDKPSRPGHDDQQTDSICPRLVSMLAVQLSSAGNASMQELCGVGIRATSYS